MEPTLTNGEYMVTPRADEKFEEAIFFLTHLKKEANRIQRTEAKAFQYYLSAFLNAAVSVVEILRAHDKSIVNRWSNNLDPKHRNLFHSVEGRRGAEVHDKNAGAKTTTRDKRIPAETVPGVTVFGPPSAGPLAWFVIPEYHFEFKNRKETTEVTEACTLYLALLRQLLREFKDEGKGTV